MTRDLIYRMSQVLKSILTRDSNEAKTRDIICGQADEWLKEEESYQSTKNPLKIVDWISEGKVGPEPNTCEAMFEAGQLLENFGVLGALGTVVFRCDNGKTYQLIVGAHICEAGAGDIEEAIEIADEGRRFVAAKIGGKVWLTDRVTGQSTLVRPARLKKFTKLCYFEGVVNSNYETALETYFPEAPGGK